MAARLRPRPPEARAVDLEGRKAARSDAARVVYECLVLSAVVAALAIQPPCDPTLLLVPAVFAAAVLGRDDAVLTRRTSEATPSSSPSSSSSESSGCASDGAADNWLIRLSVLAVAAQVKLGPTAAQTRGGRR